MPFPGVPAGNDPQQCHSLWIIAYCKTVWFTLTETETEVSVNGKIFIPLTETKTETKNITKNGNETETEKFETETDKYGLCPFSFPLYFRFTPSRTDQDT